MGIANNKKKILVVDDDKSVSEMLKMLLETRGYKVSLAHNSKETFSLINEHTDLVLLDLVLPDEDGFDVCRRIREGEQSSNIPIIILSAKLLQADVIEGLYLGADDYLTKPFDFEELVARMEAVMRRSSIYKRRSNLQQGEDVIVRELREIIEKRQVRSFFQPIFKLDSFEILGVEALTRPETKSMLSNPELIFEMAIQFGFYQELEMLAWRSAIEAAALFLEEKKLFLNCNPYFVEGENFLSMQILFEQANIKESNVVLEITERSEIANFKLFYTHLLKCREMGFNFAVDDVGGGYASIQSIVETRPEIVKIDKQIVRGLSEDAYKRSVVRFIVSFCKENNILSVAEGIETREDFQAVRNLGIDSGQGYYLYRPTPKVDYEDMENEMKSL